MHEQLGVLALCHDTHAMSLGIFHQYIICIVDKRVFLSRYIWIHFTITRLKNSGEANYKYAIYLREMWSRHNKSRMSWFISFLPKPVLIHFTFEDNLIENFKCFSVMRYLESCGIRLNFYEVPKIFGMLLGFTA